MKCDLCDHDIQIIIHNEATTMMPELITYKCKKCGKTQQVAIMK